MIGYTQWVMLKYYYRAEKSKRSVEYAKKKAGAVGVVEKASDEDIARIARTMHLTREDLADIFDAQEIPRLEIEDGVVLLFIRAPLPLENNEFLETQLYMLVYNRKQLYVTTSSRATHFMELLTNQQVVTTQTTDILIEFLLYISKQYAHYINDISRKVEQARAAFTGLNNKQIEQLVNFEVILNEYVSVLSPMQQICASLVQNKHIGWREEDRDLLEDLTNSMAQSATVCLVNLKKIQTLRGSFEVVFTNRLNQTVKLLTSVTILLTIPTMLASMFGMNVGLPFSQHPQAFWLVLLIALVLSLIVGIIFKKNKWV